MAPRRCAAATLAILARPTRETEGSQPPLTLPSPSRAPRGGEDVSVRQDGVDLGFGVGPVAVDQFAQVVALGLETDEGRGVVVAFEVLGGGFDGALQAL